jgi:hypothetical protein
MVDPKNPVSFKDRRDAPRVKVSLPTHWERNRTKRAGTITSLSRNGCFILSGGLVKLQEPVRLQVTLPNNETITIVAEVVDVANEIGFAASFIFMEVTDQLLLESFIEERLAAEASQ